MRIFSLITLVEEITPRTKKLRLANKGKEKVDSRSSNIWDNAILAMTRAQDAFTTE